MMNPHHALASQSSRASSCDGGETDTTHFDFMGGKDPDIVDTKGDGEAEYESSHRRRKVRLLKQAFPAMMG